MQKNLNFNFMRFNLTHALFLIIIFSSLSSNAMGMVEKAKLKLRSWRAGQGQHHNLGDSLENSGEQENKEQEDQLVDSGLQETITLSHHQWKNSFYVNAIYYAVRKTKSHEKVKEVKFIYGVSAQCFLEAEQGEGTRRLSLNPFAKSTNITFPNQKVIESKVLAAIHEYVQEHGLQLCEKNISVKTD